MAVVLRVSEMQATGTHRKTPRPARATAEALVITDDMLRHRANGETVENIQPGLLIPTGRRKGHSASLRRALAGHEKAQAYPEVIETAHADFAVLQQHGRNLV
ncbi:hypothetical protein [Streptomyces griseorubiginosus]|uniref:Uncharacterized protein n=1 Tax=Streptomyces griseorubiginosus TaxID=67304 RepID=A0A101RPK6_9ACTN|nr:hypothetical protein [Streptomyces griseorubiginosus]KUN59484.1 hypothetical protein AQJ54_39215 [Streptomyces griseorubiginosus]